MGALRTALLGVIQGATEFLPISSSGHLLIAKTVFNWNTFSLTFDVLLHCATLLVILWYLRVRLIALCRRHHAYDRILIFNICISTLVTAAIGIVIQRYIPLDRLVITGYSYIATALLITSAFLYSRPPLYFRRRTTANTKRWADRRRANGDNDAYGQANAQWTEGVQTSGEIDWKIACIIGLFQGIAVLPGISRAGATIAIAQLCGVKSDRAFEYSFLIAIPSILGALLLQVYRGQFVTNLSTVALGTGIIAAMISGYIALRLLRYIHVNARMVLFVPYVLFLALLCFLL